MTLSCSSFKGNNQKRLTSGNGWRKPQFFQQVFSDFHLCQGTHSRTDLKESPVQERLPEWYCFSGRKNPMFLCH
jgi:hypothetical protein